jgi:hypothetical protein
VPASSILGPDVRLFDAPFREIPVSAEFNWWLLIVGLIAGGALTWLVLAESTRREREIGDEELAAEAAWIARSLHHEAIDGEVARDVLQAHRRYLGFPPPDALVDADELSVADDPAADLGVPPPDDPRADLEVSPPDDPRADLEVSADQPAPDTSPGTDTSS